MREFRTGLTETLVPTHPGLVLAVPRLCPPPDDAQRTLKNSQKAMDPIDCFSLEHLPEEYSSPKGWEGNRLRFEEELGIG